jgi:hypothetical protein
LSYFNEIGHLWRGREWHLLGSNIEWGQDILLLKEWADVNPSRRPIKVDLDCFYDVRSVGVPADVYYSTSKRPVISDGGGWYVMGVNRYWANRLRNDVPPPFGSEKLRSALRTTLPIHRIGTSLLVFRLEGDTAGRESVPSSAR